MFNSNFEFNNAINKWKEKEYFKKIPDNFGKYYDENDILYYDNKGNSYFDMGLIMYTAINIMTKMCEDIPKQSIINETTLAHNGNIKLNNIQQIILVTPTGIQFKFNRKRFYYQI
jgi:uncharacterized protein with ATP-grasp and redox domains